LATTVKVIRHKTTSPTRTDRRIVSIRWCQCVPYNTWFLFAAHTFLPQTAHTNLLPNGISISPSVFAKLTDVHRDRQTAERATFVATDCIHAMRAMRPEKQNIIVHCKSFCWKNSKPRISAMQAGLDLSLEYVLAVANWLRYRTNVDGIRKLCLLGDKLLRRILLRSTVYTAKRRDNIQYVA